MSGAPGPVALVKPVGHMTDSHTLRHVWEAQCVGGEGARRGKGKDLTMRTSRVLGW